MSTHNIGFYEDLTKVIFQLSSNITKYAHKVTQLTSKTRPGGHVSLSGLSITLRKHAYTIYYDCFSAAKIVIFS